MATQLQTTSKPQSGVFIYCSSWVDIKRALIMETFVVIEEPQDWYGLAIMSYSDYKSSDCQRTILFIGTNAECQEYRNRSIAAQELIDSAYREHELYSIQDDVWPSRYWNKDKTDYIDLSGEQHED